MKIIIEVDDAKHQDIADAREWVREVEADGFVEYEDPDSDEYVAFNITSIVVP